MLEFTPDPWHIERVTDGAPEIVAENGRRIAKVLYWLGSEDEAIVEANARLIVKSPDMYSELRSLLAACTLAVEHESSPYLSLYLSDSLLERVRSTLSDVEA